MPLLRNLFALLLFSFIAGFASGAIINVEFKFSAFTGELETSQEVPAVPGKARIFINNVPFSEQDIPAQQLPLLFNTHEVAPAISTPMASAGSVVRKGKNQFRIEFTPDDPDTTYHAQLRWTALTDRPTDAFAIGPDKATNQTQQGVDDRKDVKGKVVFEHEFTADFALDLPWHHYPPVTALTNEDKAKIALLLQARADWFKPDFAKLYHALEQNDSLKVEDVRRAQCLEKTYKAGLRLNAPPVGELEFTITGSSEVIVSRAHGSLFGLDEKALAAARDEDTQMCASTVLSAIYPGHVAVVKKPDGNWEIVD